MLEQNAIRLSREGIQAIITAFKDSFSGDKLWIFGSRVDMNAKGGDIDLYIETMETDAKKITDKRVKFLGQLWKELGEQKIDIIINIIPDEVNLPIYNQAKSHGVRLL